jgi:hypothetical protein
MMHARKASVSPCFVYFFFFICARGRLCEEGERGVGWYYGMVWTLTVPYPPEKYSMTTATPFSSSTIYVLVVFRKRVATLTKSLDAYVS